MLVDSYTDMTTLITSIYERMEKYNDKFGHYPEKVVIDSVSQIFMDVIDVASQTPNVYGSQGAEVTKEMAILTKFIHEDLEVNGIDVILLNHVIPEIDEGKETGSYVQFGSGKFLAKGGFYSITNESITIVPEGAHRAIYTRGTGKQARTMNTDLPDKMWVANTVHPDKSKKLKEDEVYFSLSNYIETLKSAQTDVAEWSLD